MGFGGVSQSRLTIAKVKKKKNATRCLFKEAARGIFLLFYFRDCQSALRNTTEAHSLSILSDSFTRPYVEAALSIRGISAA